MCMSGASCLISLDLLLLGLCFAFIAEIRRRPASRFYGFSHSRRANVHGETQASLVESKVALCTLGVHITERIHLEMLSSYFDH